MPTNFPTSVDNFTNPTANDSLNLPSHSTQHANANDAIEAIEGYLLNGGQGLTLVKKQTIGTAVSSVTVTGAFSAAYENYKIVVSGGTASTADNLSLILGSTTAGYNFNLIYQNYGTTTLQYAQISNGASWQYFGRGNSTAGNSVNCELQSPFDTKYTRLTGSYLGDSASGTFSGSLNNGTSYTSFTIGTGGSTLTGGTIYVYGYGIGQ